ncbi:MAG TPA: CAP domain-containing protein [Candidatus Saccharimonadales bacterium]|nr:CAP domain-containing protein [Candidatus Saccharimonadales bacterium]
MDKFKKFTIYLLLIFSVLFYAPLAHADSILNIPQLLKYDGLTFTEPLTIMDDKKSLLKPLDIHFETQATALTNMLVEYEEEKLKIQKLNESLASISASPTSILSPTNTSTPIKSDPPLSPTVTPTPQTIQTGSNSSNGGLNADALFSMSNSYRKSHGLAEFQTDARVCTLAAQRAPEIGAEIAEGHMHSGKNSHNFPYWFNENIISMNSEAAAFNWWVNDPIHHDAIVGAYANSCVACSGNSCVQEFTNFQGK